MDAPIRPNAMAVPMTIKTEHQSATWVLGKVQQLTIINSQSPEQHEPDIGPGKNNQHDKSNKRNPNAVDRELP